jgi:tocopherol O-methyltransferase
MICCPNVEKQMIRRHYDVATLFYRLLWGPHIHHGLWHNNETVAQAQLQLTDTLAKLAGLRPGMRVLDVGCGLGGSSIHLARHYDCHVLGLTISPIQRSWATVSSHWRGLANKTRFICCDADQFETARASFDAIWIIECSEHLFDKPDFFRRSAHWLRPGGRMAICAWLAGETNGDDALARQVYDVCEGFYCPSLGTAEDYVAWMHDAGLVVESTYDWTENVQRTWEICQRRVAHSGIRWLAPLFDRSANRFLDHFHTLLNAYRSRAMQYGCFIAGKPAAGTAMGG